MSNLKAQLEEEYQKQSRELISKKEKLFDIGDMRQWDVDIPKARLIPKEEIFKKKELAFPVMLKTVRINIYHKLTLIGKRGSKNTKRHGSISEPVSCCRNVQRLRTKMLSV